MDDLLKDLEISDDDLRAALSDINKKGYIDITEEDLKHVYLLALQHAKARLVFRILVKDIMTKDVITVHAHDDLEDVLRLLAENRISGIPVIDDENRPVGLISESDILSLIGMRKGHTFRDVMRHILGEPLPGRRGGNRPEDIMSSPVITTGPDENVSEVAKILDERKIKRLPVVDGEGKVIGIVSRGDIVRAIGKK
jgi:CBS domain-containing membrane protein